MEYPSNSDMSKREQKEERPERFEKSKGLSGETVTKNKSVWRKFIGAFVQEDKENLKKYIMQDVIIPTIKDTMINTLSMVLYGDTRAGSSVLKSSLNTAKKTLGTKVSYRQSFEEARRTSRTETREGYDYKEILFRNRGDADILLRDMKDALARYKLISIFDMYDMAGRDDAPYTYRDWGWTDIGNPSIVSVGGGYYVIDLPSPLPIK